MPLFICEECGAIENTATGFYWARKHNNWEDKSLNGKALCRDCVPDKYIDGSKSDRHKRGWTKSFPKEIYDPVKHKDWDLINKTCADRGKET